MKLNLTKYGFKKEGRGYSVSGLHVDEYRIGKRVIVQKATEDGKYHILVDLEHGTLCLKQMEMLPHYKALEPMFSVTGDNLTDELLSKFANDCLAFEKEYEKMEAAFVYPTRAELIAQIKKQNEHRKAEYEEARNLCNGKVLSEVAQDDLEILRLRASGEINAEEYASVHHCAEEINGLFYGFDNYETCWLAELKKEVKN